MMADEGNDSKPALPQTITFHYIKTTDYRPVHVDGVIGGLTPKGLIHMAVFTEHVPIPQKTVQPVSAEGVLGAELLDQRVARDGVIRDVVVGLVMNADMAGKLIEWLQGQITTLKAHKKGDEK